MVKKGLEIGQVSRGNR